jgi:hypothetical protein
MPNEVQTTFVPFGELRPDSGEFMNSDLVQAVGVYPIGDIYFPLQPLYARTATIGGASTDKIRGHANQNPPVGLPKHYLYRTAHIFVLNPDTEPWTVGGVASGLTVDDDAGQFCGFGSHEIFAAGHSQSMQIRVLGVGGFVDCITDPASPSDPRPKYVCPIGERILIGNIANASAAGAGTPDVNTDLVWWSATRNPRTFGTAITHPADRTGFNALHDDAGPIAGMIGGKEYALIFKRRGLWRMDFGGAYGFSFRAIPQAYGCLSHLSICALGRDVYFWSDGGPCVYRDDQVIPLAYGKVSLQLLETKLTGINSAPSLVGCGADSVNQLVWWVYTYTGTDGSGGIVPRQAKLVYSPQTDRFSYAFDVPLEPTAFLVDETGDAASAQIGACWDGYNVTGLPLCGGVFAINNFADNNLKAYTYSGELGDRWWSVDGILKTGFFAMTGRGSSTLHRVRPVIRTKPGTTIPNLSVTIYTKDKPWEDPAVWGPFTLTEHSDKRGYITCPGVPKSQLIQIKLTLPKLSNADPGETNPYSNIREIEGVQVEFTPAGEKG